MNPTPAPTPGDGSIAESRKLDTWKQGIPAGYGPRPTAASATKSAAARSSGSSNGRGGKKKPAARAAAGAKGRGRKGR